MFSLIFCLQLNMNTYNFPCCSATKESTGQPLKRMEVVMSLGMLGTQGIVGTIYLFTFSLLVP